MPRLRPALLLLLTAALAGCSVGDDDDAAPGGGTAAAAAVAATTTDPGLPAGTTGGAGGTSTTAGGSSPSAAAGLDLPALVERVQPSVVAVRVRTAEGGGEGSGVIFDADGLIVTNNHVVEGGQQVRVVYASGDTVEAEIVAADPDTDLAVLRVADRDLPAAPFRDGLPRVGEFAMALGNPLGFEGSVSAGIVSGLGRSIPGAGVQGGRALVDLIQTDAAISPGNSGGALVDAEGRIIGINVAYLPPQAGAVSLGFAIPAPTARSVIDQLLEDGTVYHPYLGVNPVDLTPQIAEQFSVDAEAGVILVSVGEGTPAARAGLRQGDVLTRAGDRALEGVGDLFAALREVGEGETLELELLRDGRRETVTVTPTARPDE
jgi:S1-C subfamily serine protease